MTDESRMISIVEDYLRAVRAGQAPDRERFLAAHADVAGPLREALVGLDFIRGAAPARPAGGDDVTLEGRQLGDFRMLREVGRGGMGVVYEAEQLSLGRRVALKVLPFAAVMDPKHLQRFRNEAQAAAHLHHTNIVPVYSVGTERGVHYYAMQFIEGESLARAIAELKGGAPGAGTTPISSHRSNREPLYLRMATRLGVQAAEALDHAHQLGIVHRDVKPANLLVDATGNLWITDFGLARFDNGANLTMTGDLVGTVRYMSPEQALAKRVPVDHRTDVYSLGATLYELFTLEPAVTGETPHAVIQEIAFKDPPPPRRLNPAIPPDLETIVVKAMAKDPAGRYATAQEMADDLRRFLEHKPIAAKRPSIVAVAQKWARRHRALVGAGLALLLLGAAGLAVGNVLIATERDKAEVRRQQAERQAALAEAVEAFLNDDLLLAIAPERLGPGVTLREVLDAAATTLEGRFAENPLVEARLRRTIGRAYDKLGLPEEAERQLSRACELFARVQGAEHPDTLLAMRDLGDALHDQGRYEDAEILLVDTVEAQERLLGSLHRDTLRSKQELANAIGGQGRHAEKEALHREILETSCRVLGANDPVTLSSMNALANALLAQGKAEEAEELHRQALAIRRRVLPEDHPDILRSMNNLAGVLSKRGEHAEAAALHRKVLEARKRVLTDDHPDTLRSMRRLAHALRRLGGQAEAESLLRQTVEAERRVLGEEDPETLRSTHDLANVLAEEGKNGEAETFHREALAGRKRAFGEGHLDTICSMIDLGNALAAQGKHADAENLFRKTWEIARSALGSDDRNTLSSMNNLANALRDLGRHAEAAALHRETLEVRRRALGVGDPDTILSVSNLAELLLMLGKRTDADLLLRETLESLAPSGDQGEERAIETVVGELVASGGRAKAAAPLCNDLAWIHATAEDPGSGDPPRAVMLAEAAVGLDPDQGAFWNTLGIARYRAGDWKGAVAALERSVDLRSGGDAHDWLFLAMARWKLGDGETARKWYHQAVAGGREHGANPGLDRFRREAAHTLGLPPP